MLLASIIDNTIATSIGNRGPVVLSQNDDFGSINFAAGLGDVAETLKLERILKGGWSVVETLRQLIAANDLPGNTAGAGGPTGNAGTYHARLYRSC